MPEPKPLKVLIVEDDEDDAVLAVRLLEKAGFTVEWRRVETSTAMAQALDAEAWDLIVADYRLPHFSGEEALYLAQQRALEIPFIIVSGTIGEERAVAMMKAGADDYLLKGNLARLGPAVERELEEAEVRRQRREAQEALREAEDRFQQFMEHLPAGAFLKEPDTRTLYVNRFLREAFGWENPVGKTAYELFPRPVAEQIQADDAKALAEGALVSEEEITDAVGRNRVFETHRFPINLADGRCVVGGIAVDVTKRKRAEETLREREQFLQTVFDGMDDGIGVRDRSLTLIRVNRWLQQRYADRMPLLGRKCYEVFQCRDTICPWCPAVRAMKTGQTQSEVTPYPSAENPTGWHELTAFPLRSADGEIIGVIEHVKDVTARVQADHERQQYEEHLRHLAAELVQAEERERQRLATNLHDSVGQTLASAKMTLQDLRQHAEADPALAEGFRRACDFVGEAVEHTRRTVFDLSPPILHEVGFEAALESLVERVGVVHDLPITLQQNTDQAVPLSEEVRIVLYRSVRELLHNVVRHAAATHATVSVHRTDEHIHITVEDDGMGFDPEATRGRGDLAAGFGLFDIRERLDYLGGNVDIRSIADKGTRVTLTAPLEPTG